MEEKEEELSLIRKRTMFKYDGVQDWRKSGQGSTGRQSVIDIRSNTATLLKEVAVILKEEEEETMKLMNLLLGSSNYLEYEKMIEERLEEEKELFRLKIERLHLEGKLTEQAAILAKQRLLHESKERRRLFEEERKQIMEDVEKLKVIEKERALSVVSKVKEINRRAEMQMRNVKETKRLECQKNREELQKLVKDAIAKGKEEYQKKVLMIKEVRAFQAFKKSLQCLSTKKQKEPQKIGLLSEMSLQELASRKELMRTSISEERSKRRKLILERIKQKEMFLDEAESFIKDVRKRRQMNQRTTDMNKMMNNIGLTESIPETFLRPIPPITHNEEMYKKRLSLLTNIRNSKIERKIKEINKKKKLCEYNAKEDAEMLNKMLEERFSDKKGNAREIRGLKRIGEKKFDQSVDSFGNKLIIKKFKSRRNRTVMKSRYGDSESFIPTKQMLLWSKFKWFITTKTPHKLPKRLMRRSLPPKSWPKEPHSEHPANIYGSTKAVNIKQSTASRKKHSIKLRTQRTIRFKRSASSMKPRMTKIKGKKRKKILKRSEKKWIELWRWFYKRFSGDVMSFVGLENLHSEYTQNIIKKVNHFYKLLHKQNIDQKKPLDNPSVVEYKNEILTLRKKLDEITDQIRMSKRRNEFSMKKAFIEKKRLKPETPLRHRLVIPKDSAVRHGADFYRQFQKIIPEHFVVHQVMAEEDEEIKEIELQPPFKDHHQTRMWFTEEEHEIHQQAKEVQEIPSGESLIQTWEIPIRRKRSHITFKKSTPLEFRLLRKSSDKYTILRNKFGNLVFTLRPVAYNLSRWEWVPVVIRKTVDGKVVDEDPEECLKKVKAVNTAVMAYIRKHMPRHPVLPKMLASRFQNDNRYLRGLRGKSRRSFFTNVPIRLILDYWQSHKYGGNPSEEPPPIVTTPVDSEDV